MKSLLKLVYTALSLVVACTVGSLIERKHYRSIEEREEKLLSLPALSMTRVVEESAIAESRLVYGSVVVGIDYFRETLASIMSLFGGKMTSFESALDRGRREALLRMKEQAKGASAVLNVRLETSSVNDTAKKNSGYLAVEIFAYGTAIWRAP